MGKHYKLPFDIKIIRKYSDINIDEFLDDWIKTESNRKERSILLDNDLHIELNKFQTYDIDIHEIIDLVVRYALSKREFRRNMGILIDLKQKK